MLAETVPTVQLPVQLYFEQSEGSHPAGSALLVLCTQHLELLTVTPRFTGLSTKQWTHKQGSVHDNQANAPRAGVKKQNAS